MNKRLLIPFFVQFIFLFPAPGHAQTMQHDTTSSTAPALYVAKLYLDSLGESSRIYNGFEFTAGYRSSAGHPFFQFVPPHEGDLCLDGVVYRNIPLAYDIVRDELIVLNPANNLYVKQMSSDVNWFSIDNHKFVFFPQEQLAPGLPGTGFFELLLESPALVLAKRLKRLRSGSRAEAMSSYISDDKFYVRLDSSFREIDSKKELLRLFRDRKNELTRFMQENNLDFRKDPAQVITKVIQRYYQFKD